MTIKKYRNWKSLKNIPITAAAIILMLFYAGPLSAQADSSKNITAVSKGEQGSSVSAADSSKGEKNKSHSSVDNDSEQNKTAEIPGAESDHKKDLKIFQEKIRKFSDSISRIVEKLEKIGEESSKPVKRSEKILPGLVKKMNEISAELKGVTSEAKAADLNMEYSNLQKRAELARIAADFKKQHKRAFQTVDKNSAKAVELAEKYSENFLSGFVKSPAQAEVLKGLTKSFEALEATIDKDFVLFEEDKKNIAVEVQKLPEIKNALTDVSARDLSLKEQKRYLLDLETQVSALGIQACEAGRVFIKDPASKVRSLYDEVTSSREYQALELKKEKDLKKSLEQEYLNQKIKLQKENAQLEKNMKKAREKLEKAKKIMQGQAQKSDSHTFDELSYARMKKAEYEVELASQAGRVTELKEKLLVARIEYQEDRVGALKLYKDSVDGKLGGAALEKAKKLLLTKLESMKKGINAIEESIDAYTRKTALCREEISSNELIAKGLEKESSWKKALALKELRQADILLEKIIENNQKLMGLEKEIQQVLKDNISELDKLRNTGEIFLLWGNTKDNFIRFFTAFAGVIAFSVIFAWLLKLLTIKVFNRTSYDFDEFIAKSMYGPITMAIIIVGSWMSFRFLYIAPGSYKRLYTVFESLTILNVTYLSVKILDIISFFLEKVVKRTATKLDDQLLPLARKTLKTLVVFAGITVLLENLGYRVTSLVTGLGIGGLAFALAAKDTLSNLFGSIMIFTDKPFVIGDWVVFNGFEGIIEDIGVRSTKIRTWKDTMITVPNSTVANASIENVSRFRSRRISTTLKLRIDTPAHKIKEAVDFIRELLDSREDVQTGHYIFYTDIDDYSHNIMIYYFALSTVWRTYLEVRQSVFLTILDEFKKRDIHLAVPTELRSEMGEI